MQTFMHNTLTKLTAALLLVTAMFSGFAPAAAYAACFPTVSFDLYAKTGTTTLYTGSPTVTFWGYASGLSGATDPAALPGPVLDVTAGDCVGVTLHNVNIPTSTSLLFQGQSIVPDTTGVATGADNSLSPYIFTASGPGTFLYEAGLTPNGSRQVGMGMYGALVVRPLGAPLQAYASATTAFDSEAVVVLSEYDTALALNPTGFDMRNYKPKYLLINGKAYPGTAPITVTAAGDDVLLRYVNAGLTSHHMGTLGLSQTLLGQDGNPYLNSHKMVSETIAPGETLDAIATIPASAPAGSQFALYDSNLMLRNNKGTLADAGFGGMLTFLTVGTGAPSGPDTTGPLLSALALSPNPSNGAVSVALSATASEITTGNNNVTAWEYSVDAVYTTVPIGSPTTVQILNATIPAGLLHGTHLVTVRAQDALGNWSATSILNLVVDTVGPTSSGLSLSPNPSSGAVGVTLSFTASDSAAGNHNITAAEYTVDAGPAQAVSIGSPAPVKILNAVIPAGLIAGSSRTISVRSQDAVGNWGVPAAINLVVDNAGPSTTSVSATYNPNNGTIPFNTTIQAVRVFASFSDAATGNSNLTNAEGFLNAPGTTGTGFPFIANDGNFNSPAEGGYADIPLVVINALSTGAHPICVHAKDAVGIWGAVDCTYMLNIDKIPPTVLSITRIGASPTNAASVQWLVTFSEPVTGVAASNFNLTETLSGITSSTPVTVAPGSGATRTVTAPTGTGSGTIRLNLNNPTNIKDAVNNVMTSTGLPFITGEVFTIDRTPPTVSSINRANPDPTNAASVQFTVTFSESVTGVTTSNFSLTTSGVSGASITSVSAGPGNTRTVTVNTGTGNGTIRLNMTNPTGVADLLGNAMTGAGLPFNGQTYTIDKTAPTVVSIVRAGADPTNAGSVNFTVTFSESVTNVSSSDFSLTETLSGSTTISVSGSGVTRTVSVTTGSGNQIGTLGLNIPNTATVNDSAGNALTAGLPFTGQVYTIDKIAPTVVSITLNNANPTTSASVSFTVNFSESVTGGTTSNFSLTTTGTYSVAPSITSVTGTGAARTVTINTGTNSGAGTHTIRLNMANSTGVADSAGNAVSNVPYTSGPAYTKN